MPWRRLAVLSGLCLIALTQHSVAQAQTTFPFQLSVQQGNNSSTISNGSTLNIVATGIGVATSFTLTVTYVGATQAVIPSSAQILGSTNFKVSAISGVPVTLMPNASVTMQVTYTPTTDTTSTGQLTLAYTEAAASSTQSAIAGTIGLNLSGSVPQFLVSYALQANSNIITVASGGTIQYLPTALGTTASATIIVVNQGSGPGSINTIAVTGAAFQPIGLPLLPAGLNSGGNLQFSIQYTPTAVGSTDTGAVTITFSDGSTFTATLQGSGTGSSYTYSLINGNTTSTIAPGTPVTLPSIAIGQTESVNIQVQNSGNASGTISVISVIGNGYSVTNTPPLPVTLAPGTTTLFTLNVTPTQPGPTNGTLRVGNDLFSLVTNGIGPNLVYSYVSAGTTSAILPGGTVPFSPVAVSQTSTLPFTIANTGTSSALISSIGVAGGTPPSFTLSGVPGLPMNLAAGASITFSVNFAPVTTGQATSNLFVNSQSFTLLGFGTSPPPLPSYQITGASGQLGPSQQPSIGLSLAQSYPLNLTGTLAIQLTPTAFAADPAVQFSTGGTTVTFTIPAGQTQAVFPNGSNTIRFQTGTVAGGITITPTFATSTGLALTPANPTVLQITVPSQAPVLLTAAVSGQTASGFVVTINGYVTSRSVTSLSFTFSVSSGVTSTTSTFSMDVSQASSIWFGSTASTAFGGQFSIAVPFTLQGLGGANTTTALQSVSITATNTLGTSAVVTATFQ